MLRTLLALCLILSISFTGLSQPYRANEIANYLLEKDLTEVKRPIKRLLMQKQLTLFRDEYRIKTFKQDVKRKGIDSTLFADIKVETATGVWIDTEITPKIKVVEKFDRPTTQTIIITKNKKGRKTRTVIPSEPYVIYYISKPLPLVDRSYCLIYFGWSSGETYGGSCYYLLRKRNGSWFVVDTISCMAA